MSVEESSGGSKLQSIARLRIEGVDSRVDDNTTGISTVVQLRLSISSDETGRVECIGKGATLQEATIQAVECLCVQRFRILQIRTSERADGCHQCIIAVEEIAQDSTATPRVGAGRNIAESTVRSIAVATIRAVYHAGLLKPEYRSNNQKQLKVYSKELLTELVDSLELGSLGKMQCIQADSILVDHFNRIASSAVITATNAPKPESILSLFDTSAWLYDSEGRGLDSFTETSLWLAWYPGLESSERTVESVVATLPKTPASAIPWIVRLFESPTSWCRFRGAVDLEDHDVMHVLLGRGLQDQDEAFVLGFAMGTAKQVNWIEYKVFQFTVSRLYPEPYRIAQHLLPAFQLGVQCGQETGVKELYKKPLKTLYSLSIADARRETGIDSEVLRRYFRKEQLAIPTTIASLRLP